MAWTQKQRITAMVIISLIIITTIIFIFVYITTIRLEYPQVLALSNGTNIRIQSNDGTWLGVCANGTLISGIVDRNLATVFQIAVTGDVDSPTYQFINNSSGVSNRQYLYWNGQSNSALIFMPATSGTNFKVTFDQSGNNRAVISSSGYSAYQSTTSCDNGQEIIMSTTNDYFTLVGMS